MGIQTFKNYLDELNEKVQLTHLEHIEDLVILDGVRGANTAIKFLRDNIKVLSGNSNLVVQGKMDGAPAIIAGTDPVNGKFFVATKSLFNKTPKINYTNDDIDANHGGGVGDKLKIALAELPKLGFKGILQGDMLFDKSIVQKETIDGVKYITFRPNTITYAVPADSEMAKTVQKANIGMAWHTTYTGDSIENLSASFKIDISSHKNVSTIFNTDTNLDIDEVLLSKEEVQAMEYKLQELESEISKFTKKDLQVIADYKIDILAYINSKVKQGTTVKDSMIKGLFDHINAKFEKERSKLKSEKGKAKKDLQKKEFSMNIREVAGTLHYALKFHLEIQKIKNTLVKELDKIKSMDTFVETPDGYKVTTPEGYVAIDTLQGGAVKLVDRLEFSKNNFNIMKKW